MKLERKLMVIGLVSLLIIMSLSPLFAVRTITSTNDNIYTKIRNSKGNYYDASAANIQNAIDDIGIVAPIYSGYGGHRGVVLLPENTTITVSSTITIKDYITLDLNGCELKPSGNFDVILLHRGARICNGIINVTGVGTFNHAAIRFLFTDMTFVGQTNNIDNMYLVSASQRGKAIYLNTSGTSDGMLAFIFVNRIFIDDFEYGIYINHAATAGDNYINGNVFSNIYMNNTKYCIRIYQAKAEATENIFENIILNCSSDTEYLIWDGGNASQYDNVVALNWDNDSGARTSYNFTSANMMYLCFRGGGNDFDLPAWNANNNCYTILNYGNGTLWTGRVTQYYP